MDLCLYKVFQKIPYNFVDTVPAPIKGAPTIQKNLVLGPQIVT